MILQFSANIGTHLTSNNRKDSISVNIRLIANGPLFSEYPNDSGYYGSGGGPACFDDEDCGGEGSGSGEEERWEEEDGSGEDYDADSGSDNKEKFEPVWPPWVTSRPQKSEENDIGLEEEEDNAVGVEAVPQFSAAPPLPWSALLRLLLPLVAVRLGAVLL